MASRRRALRDTSRRWQDEQLGLLARKTYAELDALPPKTPLPCPQQLKGLILFFEASIGPSFEMLPDGRVIRDHSEEEEDAVVEQAPWMGRTGLPEDLERELPRYVRREFGESVFDDESLRAMMRVP